MLTYFIDGYNAIKSSDELCQGSLDQQRENLLQRIQQNLASKSSLTHVIVVFDGKPGRSIPAPRPGITVRFSMHTDADTCIKQWVDAMRDPSQAIVVTNDRAIQYWVRGAKAKVIPCSAFLQAPKTKKPRPSEKPSILDQKEINKEFEKVWN